MKQKYNNKISLKQDNTHLSLVGIAYLAIIIILTFSPCVGWVPFFRMSWLFLAIIIGMSFVVTTKYYISPPFFFLSLYFVVLCIKTSMGVDKTMFPNWISDFYEVFLLLAPSVLFYYAVTKKSGQRFCFWVSLTVLSIILFETIATSVIDELSPSIIRTVSDDADNDGPNSEFMYSFYKVGMANFILPHALPIIIPPLVMAIKNKVINIYLKVLLIFSLVSFFWLIILSGSSTALLLAFLALFMSILTIKGKNLKKQRYVWLVMMVTLPIILSDELKLFVIDIVSGLFEENKYFLDKVNEFEYSIRYGRTTGDMAARSDLYGETIDRIFESPMFGTSEKIGHHSSFLDRLAVFGVFGIMPYFLFFYNQFKLALKYINKEYRLYYLEGLTVALLMLLFKDMDEWEVFFMLFTVLPIFMFYFSRKIDNESRNSFVG